MTDIEGPVPHAQEASLRFRVALVAIAAAAITALATLGGQLWAAAINSGTAREVAETNFSLNQRITAYSKHITDQTAFRAKAAEVLKSVRKPFSAIVASTDLNDLRDLLIAVEQDDSMVAIVGSATMVTDSHDVLSAYQNLYGTLNALISPISTDPNVLSTPALSGILVTQANDQYQSSYALAQRFTQDAHAELGQN